MAEAQEIETKKFTPGQEIDIDAIGDVPIEISVVLGEAKVTVDELLKMGEGAVIELNRKVGEPVELYVNQRCVAKGEVVIVENKIGITMTEILKGDKE
ncbi:MAG TPA: flagellar motor switch protein FliN [Alphaproteobacteria bacterium]|nr:flagellar motor switch protein FliN [Alphaproteobacteria bacterium]